MNDFTRQYPEKLEELLVHWEAVVLDTATIRRACDWGTMTVPVDEFEDD